MKSKVTQFTSKFLAVVYLSISATSGFAEEVKLKIPKTSLPSISGKATFGADAFKEDVTVIQFWASWCTGCAVVMEQMSELLVKNPHVGYVSISLDETKDVATKYFANKSETAKKAIGSSFLDASGESFSQINGVDTLPYLIVVDKQGRIIKRILGHPTKDDLELITMKKTLATPMAPVTSGAKK